MSGSYEYYNNLKERSIIIPVELIHRINEEIYLWEKYNKFFSSVIKDMNVMPLFEFNTTSKKVIETWLNHGTSSYNELVKLTT